MQKVALITGQNGTPRKLMDVGKLKGLGWEPAIVLEQGRRDTYNWFLENLEQEQLRL